MSEPLRCGRHEGSCWFTAEPDPEVVGGYQWRCTVDPGERRRRPYPDDEGRTHYEGCWRAHRHHNCAIERVEQLERDLAAALGRTDR